MTQLRIEHHEHWFLTWDVLLLKKGRVTQKPDNSINTVKFKLIELIEHHMNATSFWSLNKPCQRRITQTILSLNYFFYQITCKKMNRIYTGKIRTQNFFLVEYTAVNPHNFLWLFESLPKKITTFRFSWRAPKYLLWSRLEKVKSSNCSITKLENYAHNVRRIYRNARLKRAAAHKSRSLLRTWCYSESSQRTFYLINLVKNG